MITQVFYNIHPTGENVWSTTYSDGCYSMKSRRGMVTRVKPTERQVRHLHKQKAMWVVKL